MKTVAIIPARLASTRLPQKLLKTVAGKTILEWTYLNAKKATTLNDIIIACDDQALLDVAQRIGAKAYLTSVDHQSGTDRIAELLPMTDADLIINIQADEPLLHTEVIDDLVKAMQSEPEIQMGTAVIKLKEHKDIINPNVVKAVIDNNNCAAYFSRSPIPYNRDNIDNVDYYKHFGIYAYRKSFLANFKNLPSSPLEQTEKLEQLRVISAGYKIKTVLATQDSIGVDTQEDLNKVAKILTRDS